MKALTRYIFSNFGGKAITRDDMEEACKKFKTKADNTINFMITYGYLIRILRGLYYVKTLEEFNLGKSADIYKVISLGLNKIGIAWYFGLYTGLRLNGATHEYFDTIFVLNDSIFRPKEIKIAGEKVKFLKLKKGLFGFGIKKDKIRFSDLEKTLLDIVYISRYRSVSEEKVLSTLEEYGGEANKEKIKSYLEFYPKTTLEVIKNAGLV